MTKTRSARALLAVANASLVVGISVLGAWVFTRGAFADGARPSEAFTPVAYALEAADRRDRDLSVVWRQLDRPRPPDPTHSKTAKVLQVPKVAVMLVSIDPANPERSVGIIEDELGVQEVVQVGQRVGGKTVERIVVVDDDGVRRASIVFEGGGDVGFERELD